MKNNTLLQAGDRVRFRPASQISRYNPKPVMGLHCVERTRDGGRETLVWLVGLKSNRTSWKTGHFYATDLILVSRQCPVTADGEETEA